MQLLQIAGSAKEFLPPRDCNKFYSNCESDFYEKSQFYQMLHKQNKNWPNWSCLLIGNLSLLHIFYLPWDKRTNIFPENESSFLIWFVATHSGFTNENPPKLFPVFGRMTFKGTYIYQLSLEVKKACLYMCYQPFPTV